MQLDELDWPPTRCGQWFVLAAAVLWGTTGTAQALAPQDAQPAVVGAVRLSLGGIALLVLAAARGALRSGKQWPIVATACAAGATAAYQLCFFAAVARTGVVVGTIVAIGSAPVLAGVLGFLVRGERPGRRWMVATTLAVLGCSLLIAADRSVSGDAAGVVSALGAGASYATFTVASKRLLEVQPPDAVTAVAFCIGAVLLSPLLLTADLSWLARPRGLAIALHLGLIATAAAYVLFARGLIAVPVATAATLSLAEPLAAGILGVVVLGERLTASAMLGVGLLASGLALLTRSAEDASESGEPTSSQLAT